MQPKERIHRQSIKLKCPHCTNHISNVKNHKGTMVGVCVVCKSTVICQQISTTETRYRVIHS